jgi:signal transduction histidine kinase
MAPKNTPTRILVVDDNATTRNVMRRMLQGGDYEVIEASNGQEAIEAFQKQAPQIILMDAEMPRMNGLQATIHIRELPGGARIPILMVTGHDDNASIKEAFEAGATDYLTKPLQMLIFQQRIKHFLERIQTDEALRAYAQALEERNQELDAYNYTIAHNLKTPLQAIKGYSLVLKDYHRDEFSEEAAEHLQKITEASNDMAIMIDQLLFLTSLKDSQVQLETVDLKAVLAWVLRRFEAEINKGGFEVILHGDFPPVRGQAAWLREILANYLSNAIKYSHHNTHRQQIQIYTETSPESVYCYVQDQGVGIQADHLPHIFEMFSRYHRQMSKGMGLGLAIAKRLANKMGGEVGVTSEVGAGSRFWVCLPKAEGTDLG